MNSEPPASDDAPEKGTARESSGLDADRWSSDGGRARRRPIAAAVGVLAVAGGISLFLFLTHGSDSKTEQLAPEHGLACPYLEQAADAYPLGDRVAYNQAIDRAAQVAEDTLDKSGQAFGEPERIALELSLQQRRPRSGILNLLTAAQVACVEELNKK
jgi:hypothetical protein